MGTNHAQKTCSQANDLRITKNGQRIENRNAKDPERICRGSQRRRENCEKRGGDESALRETEALGGVVRSAAVLSQSRCGLDTRRRKSKRGNLKT